ncbi:CLUMA_CG009522, isoform A [Clunio marinus]|uniref:Signal recognition particle 9 kDa protein n=1 Tax=Clunio marinus TaxID=568069 RepID=A0A1J1IAU5_9DIPT|nr:CLUMA_CG009522, isoform A [Clunio marinus]
MVYAKTFEDFEVAAEAMLLDNPEKCRYSMKYSHSKKALVLKVTNNEKCVQYKTENQPDLKKIEKFTGNVMNHITNKD